MQSNKDRMANNELIAKLKRARGIIKGQLTRAHNWIKAFDAQEQQIEGVEVRLSTIERAWVEFGKNQDTLEEADPNAVDDDKREAFESEYYAASATAKALIAARQRGDESQITGGRNSGHTNNSADQIKLPPINLPTFNGSYDQWPNFRDTFKAVIDENQNLSDIKKLYYLRLALKGLAAEIIASITMSADNYEIAWKLLEGRFENKRVLVHHHLQALIEFPAIQKESHAALRQLLDTMEKHVRALKKLNQPTEHWSTILVFLLTAKLDSTTKRAWENKTSSKDVASYEQFIEFITNRCIMLETLQLDQQKGAKVTASNANSKINNAGKRAVAAASTSEAHTKCPVCAEGDHKLYQCPAFLNLTPQVRIKKVQRIKVCSNCLQKGHKLETCSYGSCRICSKKHNTLLHCNKQSDIVKASGEGHPGDSLDDSLQFGGTQPTTIAHCAVRTSERGLLATAIIKIQDAAGESHECRAFLDPGSQTNFITRDLCNRMQLPQYKNYLPIRGIHGTQTIAFTETQATILSRFDTLKVKLKFSVLPKITTQLPLSKINIHKLKIPETLTLADPFFHVPGRIDVLLGSSIFWNLLGVGQVKLGKNQPVAQKTKLGWIIAGPIGSEEYNKPSVISIAMLSSTDTIENQLERFWHIEEGAPFTEPSENDKICEEEFVQTHRRNFEGRFEVRLPFRGNIEQLGSSREIAIKRLKALKT